jgi:nucleotide-binding universal stress UspA family protein
MTYKTILVHLDDSPRSAVRAQLAAGLARDCGAHLVGVAIVPPLVIPGTSHPEVVVRILTDHHRENRENCRKLAAAFADTAQRSGVSSVEGRVAEGDPAQIVALHARYADLVVAGQPGGEAGMGSHFVESVLLTSGRPVLIVPTAMATDTLGTTVVVAWNASREATRAVTDALPMLARAGRTHVVTVNATPDEGGHGEVPGTDIALYLSRHGVKAEVDATYAEDVDIGEWLLSRAADLGADLIVMGAYGHSRLRELVLGGATRTLIDSMTVPVLMSH